MRHTAYSRSPDAIPTVTVQIVVGLTKILKSESQFISFREPFAVVFYLLIFLVLM